MHEIAIVGLGCLFPEASTPREFWDHLLAQRDVTSPTTADDIGISPREFFDPKLGTADKICYWNKGHIRHFHFDPQGYHLPEEELTPLDRIFHWSLYTAREALFDSRLWGTDLRRCGLILGSLTFPTLYSQRLFSHVHGKLLEPYVRDLLQDDRLQLGGDWPTEISPDNAWPVYLPARITSRALALGGPCYAIDAACATALYVIKLAGYYLATGLVDTMLAGAVCGPSHLYISHGFNVLQALPGEGQSAPFDRHSRGIKLGEGAGFFALKRYRDAVAAGDEIYAVVESIGLANDGRGQHILRPSSRGQLRALERAYTNRERRVDYIECHATGTPHGDQTELHSLEQFFGEVPLLGGNKANWGHMLTASGLASILKVVLAMRNAVLPATIGIDEPLTSPQGRIGARHFVREQISWPQHSKIKRAGVNAFGFGGTNAHLLLREHSTTLPPVASKHAPLRTRMAIVGMAVQWGEISELDEFAATISQCRQHFRPCDGKRWLGIASNHPIWATFGFTSPPEGVYCQQLEFDYGKFLVPPNSLDMQLFQHLLLLTIAERALRDAGISLGEKPRNIAVVVGGDIDLVNHRSQTRLELPVRLRQSLRQCGVQLPEEKLTRLGSLLQDCICPIPHVEGMTGGIGNLIASRIAAFADFTGPCFLLAEQENSVYRAIEVAQLLLDQERGIEAVVVAGVEQSAGLEQVLSRNLSAPAQCSENFFAFDQRARGWSIGEGGGAIVLQRYDRADRGTKKVYAVVEAIHIENSSTSQLTADIVAQTCHQALAKAGVSPTQIGYIEAHASGITAEDEVELAGLNRAYEANPGCLIGSVKANIGHTFAASGVASIIKTALCLYHQFLPGIPQTDRLRYETALSIAKNTRSWPPSQRRIAAVNSLGINAGYGHLILAEAMASKRDPGQTERTIQRRPSLYRRIENGHATIAEWLLEAQDEFVQTGPGPVDINEHLQQYLGRYTRTEQLYAMVKTKYQQLLCDILQRQPLPEKDAVLPPIIWNREQIIEMANGSVAAILGPEYREIDQHSVRIRVPSPPFLFVSRVTAHTAQKGKLAACWIEWEYDIPEDEWYIANGTVPALIPFESSHVLILALGYIGCDAMFPGLRYRALDHQSSFPGELPAPGETIRGRVHLHKFVQTGRNLLLFHEYTCYRGEQPIFQCRASAGLFSTQDTQKQRGLKIPEQAPTPAKFQALLSCCKNSFSDDDIRALQKGDFARCFGAEYAPQRSFLLASPKLQMLDRVPHIKPDGGLWGQGKVVGEKEITPDHWVFRAHFKNDPVLPGTMMVEGCIQLSLFYMYYLGLHTLFNDFRADFLPGSSNVAKFRGEVTPQYSTLQFRVQPKTIGIDPQPHLVCLAEIIHGNSVIGVVDGLSIRLRKNE